MTFAKPAGDRRDYAVRATFADSDTIESVAVDVDAGITLGTGARAPGVASDDPTVAVLWLEGGTAGVTYGIRITLTTTLGRILTTSFDVKVIP